MERIVGTFEDYETYKKEQDKLGTRETSTTTKAKTTARKNQGCLIRKNENMKL